MLPHGASTVTKHDVGSPRPPVPRRWSQGQNRALGRNEMIRGNPRTRVHPPPPPGFADVTWPKCFEKKRFWRGQFPPVIRFSRTLFARPTLATRITGWRHSRRLQPRGWREDARSLTVRAVQNQRQDGGWAGVSACQPRKRTGRRSRRPGQPRTRNRRQRRRSRGTGGGRRGRGRGRGPCSAARAGFRERGAQAAAATAAATAEAVAALGTGVAAWGAGAVDSARPGPRLAVVSSWRPRRGLSTWWCSAPLALRASLWPRRWLGSRWTRRGTPACPGPWQAVAGRSCRECWRGLPWSWVKGAGWDWAPGSRDPPRRHCSAPGAPFSRLRDRSGLKRAFLLPGCALRAPRDPLEDRSGRAMLHLVSWLCSTPWVKKKFFFPPFWICPSVWGVPLAK